MLSKTPYLFLLGFLFVSTLVSAQSEDICSSEDIRARASEAIEQFDTSQFDDMDSALESLSDLQSDLESIQTLCANIFSESDSNDVGSGTLSDPYSFGIAGDSGQGFTLQITSLLRPADQIIRSANRFNDRPGTDEEYVIIEVLIECNENYDGRCETNYFDYELVGDKGTGGLPFLIRSSESSLTLLYRENMFRDEYIAYDAIPSLDNAIPITMSASINVRSGPGTNFNVVGSVASGENALAFGRNTDSTWVQINSGWVFTELVSVEGDVENLPITAP